MTNQNHPFYITDAAHVEKVEGSQMEYKIQYPEGPPIEGKLTAIAVVLLEIKGEPYFLITQRGKNMKFSKNLVFPGGGVREEDSSSREAAVREFVEETAIPAESLLPISMLPPVANASGNVILPTLFLLTEDPTFYLLRINAAAERNDDTGEVKRAFLVPARQFFDPELWKASEVEFTTKEDNPVLPNSTFLRSSIPVPPVDAVGFPVEGLEGDQSTKISDMMAETIMKVVSSFNSSEDLADYLRLRGSIGSDLERYTHVHSWEKKKPAYESLGNAAQVLAYIGDRELTRGNTELDKDLVEYIEENRERALSCINDAYTAPEGKGPETDEFWVEGTKAVLRAAIDRYEQEFGNDKFPKISISMPRSELGSINDELPEKFKQSYKTVEMLLDAEGPWPENVPWPEFDVDVAESFFRLDDLSMGSSHGPQLPLRKSIKGGHPTIIDYLRTHLDSIDNYESLVKEAPELLLKVNTALSLIKRQTSLSDEPRVITPEALSILHESEDETWGAAKSIVMTQEFLEKTKSLTWPETHEQKLEKLYQNGAKQASAERAQGNPISALGEESIEDKLIGVDSYLYMRSSEIISKMAGFCEQETPPRYDEIQGLVGSFRLELLNNTLKGMGDYNAIMQTGLVKKACQVMENTYENRKLLLQTVIDEPCMNGWMRRIESVKNAFFESLNSIALEPYPSERKATLFEVLPNELNPEVTGSGDALVKFAYQIADGKSDRDRWWGRKDYIDDQWARLQFWQVVEGSILDEAETFDDLVNPGIIGRAIRKSDNYVWLKEAMAEKHPMFAGTERELEEIIDLSAAGLNAPYRERPAAVRAI